MGAIFTAIGGIIKLIILWIMKVQADDAVKEQKLEEAGKEIKDGIKRRDPSRITAGFDRATRV